MKKILYLLIFITSLLLLGGCCCSHYYSCEPEPENFTYGPEFLYQLSNFYGKDANKDSKLVGNPGIGGYLQYNPGDIDKISFRTGVRYLPSGSRFDYSTEGTKNIGIDRLNYLTVPLNAMYKISDKIQVQAGPDFSFLLGAKQIMKNQDLKTIHSGTDSFNKFQMGFNLEASYNLKHGIEVFAGYNRGLNTIFSSNSDQKIFNNGFNIGARYRINRFVKAISHSHDHDDNGGGHHRYYHNDDNEKGELNN